MKDFMEKMAENAEKARYIRAVYSPVDCNKCVHYTHLYDDEELHILDDCTDGWYEPVSVYGCALEFEGFECSFKSRNYENNKQKTSEK